MPPGKPIIYWDTCVFLAWIKNEDRPNNEMAGVTDVAEKIHKDHLILLTSVLTTTEILESTLDDTAKQRLNDFFKRKNCQRVNVDERISQLASDIRDYYKQQQVLDGLRTISTPDAIHLATAVHYGATEFHTFDENRSSRGRPLMPLSKNVAGQYPLIICKPPIPTVAGLPLFPEQRPRRKFNFHEEFLDQTGGPPIVKEQRQEQEKDKDTD